MGRVQASPSLLGISKSTIQAVGLIPTFARCIPIVHLDYWCVAVVTMLGFPTPESGL